MARDDDELRRLLGRVRATRAGMPGRPDRGGGPAGRTGTVVNGGAMPTTAPGVFLLQPTFPKAAESEGSVVSFSRNTSPIPTLVLGPGVPAVGEELEAFLVDGRWVAERGGGGPGGGGVNPCRCTWPRVLSYLGNVQQATAGFYFVNTADNTPEPVYTLSWQARPADIPFSLQLFYFNYPGGVSDPYYIDMPAAAWFSDPIPGTSFGSPTNIYFYMWVQQCQSHVMVIDAPYGVGTVPDGTKGAGNNVLIYQQTSCNPFEMKVNFLAPVSIWGDHGPDDIVPDTTGGGGMYTNARVGL